MSDDSNNDNEEYKVGYKKPPKEHQFPKGTSGNKSGRKKGKKNLKTDLIEELSEEISIVENGSKIKTTKQRAMIKALCAKAMSGNPQNTRILADLVLKLIQEKETEEKTQPIENVEDKQIIEGFIKRHNEAKNIRKEDKENDNDE